MNTQIKKLLEQSGLQPYYDAQEGHIEKFAELLIKECLQQCEQIRNDALTQKKSEFLTESGKMLYEGVYGGANNCGYAIQQHFGVEK
jgi:2-iminoacetate synthase ThiH